MHAASSVRRKKERSERDMAAGGENWVGRGARCRNHTARSRRRVRLAAQTASRRYRARRRTRQECPRATSSSGPRRLPASADAVRWMTSGSRTHEMSPSACIRVRTNWKHPRLLARAVATGDVDGPAGRVERVGAGRLHGLRDQQLLVARVARRARRREVRRAAGQRLHGGAGGDEGRERALPQRPVLRFRGTELRREFAHARADRDAVRVQGRDGEALQRARAADRVGDVLRRGERRVLGRRVHEVLVGGFLGRERGRLLQRRRVIAVLAHDRLGCEQAPVVGGGVVLELREEVVGLRRALRIDVEVELHVGHGAAPVRRQHALQVADPHVVAREGEVVASELLLGDLQVADGRSEGAGGHVARVGLGARDPQVAQLLPRLQDEDQALLGLPAGGLSGDLRDLLRERIGEREVDLHAEELVARASDDLREPDGARGLAGGGGVRPARALQVDEGLEGVRIDRGIAARDGALDGRSPLGDALGGRKGAAGTSA